MKKIIIFLLVISSILSLSACSNKSEKMENVSDLCNYHMVGNSDNYYCEIIGGKREFPLAIDGVCGKIKDYVKIKVLPKANAEGEYKYRIGINEKVYEGTLQKDVTSNYLTVVLECSDLEDSHDLKITVNDTEEIIPMKTTISKDMLSYSEAKKIAEAELKNEIAEMSANSNDYEMYVKFIQGEVGSPKFFWYVSFMTDKNLCAVLIDPMEKTVVAKRT